MKKKYAYLLLLVLFFGASAFVLINYKHHLNNDINAFFPLLERKQASDEWTATKSRAANLIRMVRENPSDKKSALALAMIYIQEGRITGDHVYYDGAALHYIHQILEKDPGHFDALTLQSLVQLSQHHFADGLLTAQQAQKINPYNAFVYGLIVDGNVETGNYKTAVEMADKMVSIRPDIRSYSRISYLREIYGDYKGAIDAMQMAVDAGIAGDETTEWSRMQLAKLYEETGDVKTAEALYQFSLTLRPGYAYALAGLGHIAMGNHQYATAIDYYTKADATVNDYFFKEQLAKLYALTGDTKKSTVIVNAVINGLNKDAKKGNDDEDIGHYADRELAYAYLLVNDHEQALQHAVAEYNRRPDNIDVNETMAWVYYKTGDAIKALPYLDVAFRTNCKNPVLLACAGLIYANAGQKEKAKSLLSAALKNDPNIDIELKNETALTLQKL